MVDPKTTEQELDLALATELQAALLPKACPTDCPHHVAAARNRMCAGVGGDFYDFIRINDDQFALVFGDVVGHGIRASLMMAQIMGFLRSRPETLSRPTHIAAGLNGMLIDLGGRIGSVLPCSLIYCVIDTPTGTGFFVNAGHAYPLICDHGGARMHELTGHNLLLGVEEFEPIEACHTFVPGDRLVMFSDGITDATNAAGEQFGRDRFRSAINDHMSADPKGCAEGVFRMVDEFRGDAPQADDETIVVVDRV